MFPIKSNDFIIKQSHFILSKSHVRIYIIGRTNVIKKSIERAWAKNNFQQYRL